MAIRIGFLGTPQPAVPGLEALLAADDVNVEVVVTNPDRPKGRGHRLQPPPVKLAAAAADVPVWQPDRPGEITGELAALELDACAVVAYGALLPADVLATARHGFVNLHFSLLPAWRGAAPVVHTLLAGDARTGVTCFVLDEGMDTGPVLTRAETTVGASETAGELTERLAAIGADELVRATTGLVTGGLTPQPQDHAAATYAPKIHPADAALDWRDHAPRLERSVRAYNPVPGAYTVYAGDRLKVHRASALPETTAATPGAVTRIDDAGPVVACGGGSLRLEEVQPPGKARMDGAAFTRGYRPAGAVLGAE